MNNIWINRKWQFFFYRFFILKKQRKQLITLRNKEGHRLAIKHSKNIQKRILTITLELDSQLPLNNHQFNFDNNSISVSPFKIPRTKDEQSPIIYKDIRQVQQQLNYTNHSLQHLTQQTTKIEKFLFSSAPRRKIGETSKSIFSSTLSSSSSAQSLKQPFIIPINVAKSNIQLATPTQTMLKEIQLRLDKLSINDINQNKNQIQTITKGKS